MSEKMEVVVKSRDGQTYAIEYDGCHFRAFQKDEQKGNPFVSVTSLLDQLNIDQEEYNRVKRGEDVTHTCPDENKEPVRGLTSDTPPVRDNENEDNVDNENGDSGENSPKETATVN